MIWHCVVKGSENNICNGTPEWEKEPMISATGFSYWGTCKLTPDTCGKCQAPKILSVDPDKESSYKHISNLKEKAKDGSKSKSAKKLEQEIAQQKMF